MMKTMVKKLMESSKIIEVKVRWKMLLQTWLNMMKKQKPLTKDVNELKMIKTKRRMFSMVNVSQGLTSMMKMESQV